MFGFEAHKEKTGLGELVYRKQYRPLPGSALRGLAYMVAYGPPRFDPVMDWFLVPIQPRYSSVLFPETDQNLQLFPGRLPFGNAIRKAYLCKSPIRQIREGDVLAFYRSTEAQGLVALGVVERASVSSSEEEITRAVLRRTVYSTKEIAELCSEGEILILIFRLAKLIHPHIPMIELANRRVFSRPPQSIMRLEGEGLEWLRQFQKM